MVSKLYIGVLWYLKKGFVASDREASLFKVRIAGKVW
jgi:hypothetical protein